MVVGISISMDTCPKHPRPKGDTRRHVQIIQARLSKFPNSMINTMKHFGVRRTVYWVLAAVILSYVIATSVVAGSAFRVASELEEIRSSGLSSDSDVGLVDAVVGRADEKIGRLESWLSPVTFTCSLVKWLPIIGDNCRAMDNTFLSYEKVSETTHYLLVSSGEVKALVDQIRTDGFSAIDSKWIDQVDAINEEADRTSAILVPVAGDSPDARWVISPLRRSEAKVVSAGRQLLALSDFVVAVTDTLKLGAETSSDLPGVFRSITGADSTQDFADPSETWRVLADQLTEFSTSLDSSVEALPDFLSESDIGRDLVDAQSEVRLFADLSESVAALLGISRSAFDQIEGDSGSLLSGSAMSSIIGYLIENEDALQSHGERIPRLISELFTAEESPSLLGADMTDKIESAVDGNIEILIFIPKMTRLLDGLFGVEGTRRYLVLGQSPAEIRPAGGFTSSVWVLEFTDGALSDTEYISVVEFGESEAVELLPDVPKPLATHMDAAVWYLRDVGWSPDFLKTGDIAVAMGEIAGVDELDGVIFVNQHSIADLIGAIGPISIGGQQVDSGNIDQVIQDGTDAESTGFLFEVFTAMINGLSAENVRSNYLNLAKTFIGNFGSNDLVINSSDSETATLLRDLDWDGRFSIEAHDAVAVFDSNIGWNKVDLSVARQVVYRAEIDTSGGITTSVRSEYTNYSDLLESTCDRHRPPAKVEDSYDQLRVGCYWNYVRSYVPLGAYNQSVAELPILESAVAVRTGLLLPGADTAEITHDISGSYVGGLAVVPAGETKALDFSYQLPPGTAELDDDGTLHFELEVFVQAGMSDRPLHGEIVFPPGYVVVSAPQGIFTIAENVVVFDLVIDSNYVLEFSANKMTTN
jgi:hypothetical protein